MNDHAELIGQDTRHAIILGSLGLAAGFLSGFFGIGGGLVLVPALMLVFGMPIKRAVGISLVTIVAVSAVAVVAEFTVKRANIHWGIGLALTIGSLAGSVIAARLLRWLPETPLRIAFACCLVISAYRMSLGSHGGDGNGMLTLAGGSMLGYFLALPVGGLAGLSSTLFGLGGGIVTVPGLALLYRDLPFHAARATSLVTIVPTSSVGAYQHYRLGTADVSAAVRMMPTAVLGAIAGVVAVNVLPSTPCRLAFAAFLLIVSVRLMTLRSTRAVRPARETARAAAA